MKSYRPWELFDDNGAVREEIRALSPRGDRRMGSNPHTNGGVLRKDLRFPRVDELRRCPWRARHHGAGEHLSPG